MILCPSLGDETVRKEFNDLLQKLGGKPMQLEHVAGRDVYKQDLSPNELEAYHRAYYLWNEHQGDQGKIGDYLTEINVTSPTGAQQLKRFTGIDATALMWDRIEALRAAR